MGSRTASWTPEPRPRGHIGHEGKCISSLDRRKGPREVLPSLAGARQSFELVGVGGLDDRRLLLLELPQGGQPLSSDDGREQIRPPSWVAQASDGDFSKPELNAC